MRQEMTREDFDTLVRAWDELNRAALLDEQGRKT